MRLCTIVMIWLLLILSNISQASVSRLSPAEGLSQSYVNTLLLDSQGFLWLSRCSTIEAGGTTNFLFGEGSASRPPRLKIIRRSRHKNLTDKSK